MTTNKPKSVYSVRWGALSNEFIVKKFDTEGTFHTDYFVNRDPNVNVCSCFAGAKTKACRHKQMIMLFQDAHRVNSGWMYIYDKKQWLEPTNVDQV